MVRITASAAVSLNGCLDDCSPQRLKLSSPEDWNAVEELRAECDAILIGAGTLRNDNPSLVIKRPELRARRRNSGMPEDVDKIVLTSSGRLDVESDFFSSGGGRKIVVTDNPEIEGVFSHIAEVHILNEVTPYFLQELFQDLGYSKVLVEGGESIHRMFFESGMIDTFRLAVAPFFVNDEQAPRIFRNGTFAWHEKRRMTVDSVELLGDTSVISFSNPYKEDLYLLEKAVEVSRLSPPSDSCYRVGAVVKTRDGRIFTGYTHETGASNHAEEEAIMKALSAGAELRDAVMYTSLEPCTHRKSKDCSCTDLIIEHGFSKVVIGAPEPALFACCEGMDKLKKNGIETVLIEECISKVYGINSHLGLK